jgi:hypothetical protein
VPIVYFPGGLNWIKVGSKPSQALSPTLSYEIRGLDFGILGTTSRRVEAWESGTIQVFDGHAQFVSVPGSSVLLQETAPGVSTLIVRYQGEQITILLGT